MKDFDTFPKIALKYGQFGQTNWFEKLPKVQ